MTAVLATINGVGTVWTIAYEPGPHFMYGVYVSSGPVSQYFAASESYGAALDTVRDQVVQEMHDNESV